jgi:hypothetical protein
MINQPAPNIVGAVVAYLRQAMMQSFQVSATNEGVWGYYARETIDGVPYAVVQHGPEQYSDSQAGGSDDYDGSGAGELVIAEGTVIVIVIAPQADLAELLAHRVVMLCRDSVAGDLPCADGELIYMRPMAAQSDPITDIGPAVPGTFRRFVQIKYKQQFYEPSGLPTTSEN